MTVDLRHVSAPPTHGVPSYLLRKTVRIPLQFESITRKPYGHDFRPLNVRERTIADDGAQAPAIFGAEKLPSLTTVRSAKKRSTRFIQGGNGTLNLTRACRYRHFESDPSKTSPLFPGAGTTAVMLSPLSNPSFWLVAL
jgi:hypothetical protein